MDTKLTEHNQHYAPSDVEAAVTSALNNWSGNLSLEDLAALDQFHTGGIHSTRELAARAGLTAADKVLDVGGGLGGAARLLAQEFGADVTVVDLTEAYCRVGEVLTARVGLSERVHFKHGNALALPFADGSFDAVWTQHSTMNIEDKAELYQQLQRVLKPGGRYVLHEITSGSDEPLHFPTMWAHSQANSFLVTPEEMHKGLTEAGFREIVWHDATEWSKAWFGERQKAQSTTAPNPLGLQLLLGPEVGTMAQNLVRNVMEGRVRIIQAIFERS